MADLEDDSCLGQMFFKCLQKHGNKTFICIAETGDSVTYSEIFSQSIRTTLKLKKKGITRNDIVSSCTHNQIYSYLPILAAQYLGAISATFDPSLSDLDTVHLLKLTQPKIIFVSEEALEFMETCLNQTNIKTELVVFGHTTKYSQFSEYLQPDKDEKTFVPVTIDETETALIHFSSGTTGWPKGICLSHRCIKHGSRYFLPFTLTDKKPVSMWFATFYWITANLNIINCIANGYSTVLVQKFDPILTWRFIEKYKVTFTFIAPYNAIVFLKYRPNDVDCSSLDVIATGSCPVTVKLMNDFTQNFPNVKILNIYGQTETGGLLTKFEPADEKEYNLQLKNPLSCGIIKPQMKWKIVDNTSEKVLGLKETGELRVKTKYCLNGYYKMDSSSAFDAEGYLKTGDLTYYDEDNCIYIVGRVKEMFKYKGWHILPAILEDVAKQHPAVEEAVVLGVPHNEDGFHPLAAVLLKDNYKNIDLNEILNFVNARVSENQQLRAGIKRLEYIPTTATGKIRRADIVKNILEDMNI